MIADANSTENKTSDTPITSPGEPTIEPRNQPGIESGTEPATQPSPSTARPTLRRFPGLIAICAYIILLAGVISYGVAQGRIPPLYLVFSVLFIAGALGLFKMLRWGWALALAAVALMSASFFWAFFTHNSYPALVQGLLNLVFFLYLVRSDLREKMR
jgi:hypothetical protein